MKKRFRGHFLTPFDGAERNKYFNKMSDKAFEYYSGSDYALYMDENNGVIYEFLDGPAVCEQNFSATFANFDNLNTAYETEYMEQFMPDICDEMGE